MYRVLLHNDDYTTMDFVVEVLRTVFHKPSAEASRIMWNVHLNGVGVAGVYTAEVAETKIHTVHRLAREHGFPLRCSMEPE
ncbi:MAG: ATP-dependent Clp protease adaptor ClpS [Deltaproteobacteria bacterium]|nr:ATP-dependent Clp protease adaptor ClpS [Deltaproteobacteria bacterium]